MAASTQAFPTDTESVMLCTSRIPADRACFICLALSHCAAADSEHLDDHCSHFHGITGVISERAPKVDIYSHVAFG